eukprot:COSAG05_NODE_434_length_9856_cov_1158.820027_6_plen_86_part_00
MSEVSRAFLPLRSATCTASDSHIQCAHPVIKQPIQLGDPIRLVQLWRRYFDNRKLGLPHTRTADETRFSTQCIQGYAVCPATRAE